MPRVAVTLSDTQGQGERALPPITGLNTSLCLLGYAVFGPSKILVLGPGSSLGPMIAATILPLAGVDGTPRAPSRSRRCSRSSSAASWSSGRWGSPWCRWRTRTISTASAFAARTGQEINGNGEMIRIGAANLAAVLFQGFPVSTSGSRKLPQPALAAVVITAYLTIESAVTAFRQQTDAQWTASGQAATGKPPDIPAAPPLG